MNDRVRIRFIKAWGHPTRNEVYGPSSGVVGVTAWQAERLIAGGYAALALQTHPRVPESTPEAIEKASPKGDL